MGKPAQNAKKQQQGIKKPTTPNLKISPSLFQRKTKNSMSSAGEDFVLALSSSSLSSSNTKSKKSNKGSGEGKSTTTTGKGAKQNKSQSTTSEKKKQDEKKATTTSTQKTNTNKNKTSSSTNKDDKEKESQNNKKKSISTEKAKTPVKAAVKVVAKKGSTSSSGGDKGDKDKANSKSKSSGSSISTNNSTSKNKDKSPSPSTKISKKPEKITTRSKSDSSPPPQSPKSKQQSSVSTKQSTTTSDNNKKGTTKMNKSISSTSTMKKTDDTGKGKPQQKVSVLATKKKVPNISSKGKSESATNNKTKKESSSTSASNSSKTTKSTVNKKQTKTKPKPKRIASLNAKAILEASFIFEELDKKERSDRILKNKASKALLNDDLKSTANSTPKERSPVSDRKRKSNEISYNEQDDEDEEEESSEDEKPTIPIPVNTKSTTKKGESSSMKNSTSGTSTENIRKNSKEKQKSNSQEKSKKTKSPSPSKKSKVTTCSTSTSTSTSTSMWPSTEIGDVGDSDRDLKIKGVESTKKHATSAGFAYPSSPTSLSREVKKKTGSQTKEKNKSASSSPSLLSGPLPHQNYDGNGTIYQPAGPLIEPHKSQMPVSSSLLDRVKIPSDLKVTYQSHPPSHQTASGSSSAKTKKSSKNESPKKNILHQPYKTTTSSTSTSNSINNQRGQSTTGASESSNINNDLLHQQQHHSSTTVPIGGIISSTNSSTSGPGGLFYQQANYSLSGHSSPFTPNKFPMVSPTDTFRSHTPYSMYAPHQQPQVAGGGGYYMPPPFYTPTLTPNNSLQVGLRQQPPPLMGPPFNPTATASYFHHSSGPIHPSNYYAVANPQLQQHSIQQTAANFSPGHAGLFHNNLSSPALACPTMEDSSIHLNINNSNSSNSNNNNNSKCNKRSNSNNTKRRQLLLLPRPTISNHVSVQDHHQTPNVKPLPTLKRGVRASNRTSSPQLSNNNDPVKTPLSAQNTFIDQTKIHSTSTLTSNSINNLTISPKKILTDHYSLPDDITITPILVGNAKNSSNNNEKKKDIVHVIDPRSGHKTTIAKHMSNTLNMNAALQKKQPKNISSVKPNNASINVGKIIPNLDVIVINSSPTKSNVAKVSPIKIKSQHSQNISIPSTGKKSKSNNSKIIFPNNQFSKIDSNVISSTVNMVLPIPQQNNHSSKRQENEIPKKNSNAINLSNSKGHKRSLIECIDGLKNKKLKTHNNIQENNIAQQHYLQVQNVPFIKPSSNNQRQRQQQTSMKYSNSNDKNYEGSSARARTLNIERNNTIINDMDAVQAASAVVQVSFNSGCSRDMIISSLRNSLKKSKLSNSNKNTRNSNQNSRGKKSLEVLPTRSRSRLLRRVKKNGESDSSRSSSASGTPRGQPQYYISDKSGGGRDLTLRISITKPLNDSRSRQSYNSHSTTTMAMAIGNNTCGNMALSALKKRAIVKPLSPSQHNSLYSMINTKRNPIWSNGWTFIGEPFNAKVYMKNDDSPVLRRCYSRMRHDGGDIIRIRDCVLLKSGPKKTDLPFVAKISALWENPIDGEMMFSLLWYYRPEHTEIGKSKDDMNDELFASKHRDCNSVATIEDKCFVMTFNEYCRYKKRLQQLSEGLVHPDSPTVVPFKSSSFHNVNHAADIANAVWSGITTGPPPSLVVAASQATQQGNSKMTPLPSTSSVLKSSAVVSPLALTTTPSTSTSLPSTATTATTTTTPSNNGSKISPEVIYFCRRVYDFKTKKMLKNPS